GAVSVFESNWCGVGPFAHFRQSFITQPLQKFDVVWGQAAFAQARRNLLALQPCAMPLFQYLKNLQSLIGDRRRVVVGFEYFHHDSSLLHYAYIVADYSTVGTHAQILLLNLFVGV